MEKRVHFVDISEKEITHRTAIAQGTLHLSRDAFDALEKNELPKGDALTVSKMAAISAAKRTSEIIPLCHPIPIEKITIDFSFSRELNTVTVQATVSAHAKTGVEMEALSAVSGALLCLWDMIKGIEPRLKMSEITLLRKEGGKSGLFLNNPTPEQQAPKRLLKEIRVAGLTMSDRASQGKYVDLSGPVACRLLESHGAKLVAWKVIPDDIEIIKKEIQFLIQEFRPRLVVTSGGTGLGPNDVTKKAVASLADKELKGLTHYLRQASIAITPFAALSEPAVYSINQTILITLPGKPKAVEEGLLALIPLLSHALEMVSGKPHEEFFS